MLRFSLKCAQCEKEIVYEDNPHFPFCSARCRMIDLGAWLDGKYTIMGNDGEAGTPDSYPEDESPPQMKGEE